MVFYAFYALYVFYAFHGFYALPRDQWIKIVLLPFISVHLAFSSLSLGAIISLIRLPCAMISTDEALQDTFLLFYFHLTEQRRIK